MVSKIQKRRSAHRQVTDWLGSEGLVRDIQNEAISHWRIGPFACCVVILHKNMKSCTLLWSDWAIAKISTRYPDQHLHPVVSVKNRHDLRIIQKKYGFLINRSRALSYSKVQKLLRERALLEDLFDLVEQIIL